LIRSRLTAAALLLLVFFVPGCTKEDDYSEPEAFSFVVYPGARYLGKLTEVTKQAHKVMKPNEEPPPVAIYDTEASVDEVANFYARSYGYSTVAPDSTNNLSAAKPPAYYRSGDLSTDVKAIESLYPKLNLSPDITKATGSYKAAEIEPRPNRPRVTVQRPYFDAITSQVVDRTLVLMSR
jgi:hypothetical protein